MMNPIRGTVENSWKRCGDTRLARPSMIEDPRAAHHPVRIPGTLMVILLSVFFVSGNLANAEQLLVKAAKVYTMTGPPLQPGAVLISDGKIVQTGESIAVPEGGKVLDLGSGILMPGLVDAYSVGAVAGSSELTREVTPDFHVLSAIYWESQSFRESLDEGITCLNIAPGSDNVLSGLSSAVKTAGERGARVANAETGLVVTLASDPSARNRSRSRPDSIYVRQPTNRMGVVWILRSTFDQAAKNSPVIASVGAVADRPNAERPQPAAVTSAAARALAGKLRVFALSRTHYDILSLVNVADEFGLSVTVLGGHEAYKVADRLAQSKVPVILGPLSTGAITGPDDTELFWNLPGKLQGAGVAFALSGGRLLEQAQFAVRFGLSPEVALQSITSTPARLLGLEGRVGALAPGSDADLIALNGEPLEFSTAIRWVMVNGKIYKEDN